MINNLAINYRSLAWMLFPDVPPVPPLYPYPWKLETPTLYKGRGFERVGVRVDF